LADVGSGKNTLLSEKSDKPELYDFPQFSKDGKGVTSLRTMILIFGDWLTLISRLERSAMSVPAQWDVEEFQLAPDGRNMAFITNEEGLSKLHLFDLARQEGA